MIFSRTSCMFTTGSRCCRRRLFWRPTRRMPVVQTLHNFRMLCANALLFRDGVVCTDCVGKSVPDRWHRSWLLSRQPGGQRNRHGGVCLPSADPHMGCRLTYLLRFPAFSARFWSRRIVRGEDRCEAELRWFGHLEGGEGLRKTSRFLLGGFRRRKASGRCFRRGIRARFRFV